MVEVLLQGDVVQAVFFAETQAYGKAVIHRLSSAWDHRKRNGNSLNVPSRCGGQRIQAYVKLLSNVEEYLALLLVIGWISVEIPSE